MHLGGRPATTSKGPQRSRCTYLAGAVPLLRATITSALSPAAAPGDTGWLNACTAVLLCSSLLPALWQAASMPHTQPVQRGRQSRCVTVQLVRHRAGGALACAVCTVAGWWHFKEVWVMRTWQQLCMSCGLASISYSCRVPLSFASPCWAARVMSSLLLRMLVPELLGLSPAGPGAIRLLCWADNGEPPDDAGRTPMPPCATAVLATVASK